MKAGFTPLNKKVPVIGLRGRKREKTKTGPSGEGATEKSHDILLLQQ